MSSKYHNYSFYSALSQTEYVTTKKLLRTVQSAEKIEQTFAKSLKVSISAFFYTGQDGEIMCIGMSSYASWLTRYRRDVNRAFKASPDCSHVKQHQINLKKRQYCV